MSRNTATINWMVGSLLGNTFNMYLFGSGILTSLNFLWSLLQTQSLDGAFWLAIDYYITKLTPFPLNEFLTATGFVDVGFNISLALGVGLLWGGYKYRANAF